MIVVDTNVIAYLNIPGEHRAAAVSLFKKDPEWVAPYLWRSEFRNLLMGYVRRKQLDLEQAALLEEEARSQFHEAEYLPASRDVLNLAHESGCSAYDCEFVALAKSLGVRLVTMDRQILKAFPAIAISLFEAC